MGFKVETWWDLGRDMWEARERNGKSILGESSQIFGFL